MSCSGIHSSTAWTGSTSTAHSRRTGPQSPTSWTHRRVSGRRTQCDSIQSFASPCLKVSSQSTRSMWHLSSFAVVHTCGRHQHRVACVQNFEVFEEDPNSSRGGRSSRRADPHFIGYTFKNWEVTAAVRGATAESGAARKPHHCVVNKLVWQRFCGATPATQPSLASFAMVPRCLQDAEH